ncbi:MurR/RpiR family transcriptional regulator [Mycoplasmopsis alligatoris]|uniref:Transcriptional regulator, RpiR family n=1 Tax=Mycoplasmopsis alligatoris A21JP2 TaxID=747682 RepID=D4XVE6_9BACT|nr:MurR/RpiR family transcriptional regulator [Mycoplasmopsis alligatoris]EFF41657.1 transcriptional regulator, RpiR family [Mycoplasmopsis alligatoris A21JP2]
MKIISNIKHIKLSKTEQSIIDFLEENPEKFCLLSINELADNFFISMSIISRLCKKLNFKNFYELKSYVNKWSSKSELNNLLVEDSVDNIIHNLRIFNHYAIEKTKDNIDRKLIEKITENIDKASKVVIYGIGSSYIAALDLTSGCTILNVNAISTNSIHDLALWLNNTNKAEMYTIIFSKSMESRENKYIYNLLNENGYKTCLITQNRNFKSSKISDVIYFDSLQQIERISALSSRISEFFISDIIIKTLALKRQKPHSKIYELFKDSWRK